MARSTAIIDAAKIAFRARFSGDSHVQPSGPSAAELREFGQRDRLTTVKSEISLFANRFGLSGEVNLKDRRGNNMSFDVEGYRPQEVFVDIYNTTQNLPHHPELFSSPAAQQAFWANVGQAALMAAGADDPILRETTVRNATTPSTDQLNIGFNRTGTSNHVAGQLFCTLANGKSYYILANRGDRSAGKPSGLTIQTYGPKKLTPDQLDQMQQQDNIAQVDSTPKFRGTSIPKTLKAKKPVAHVAMKQQKSGNCTVANTNALVFSALVMERIRQLNVADPKQKDFDTAATFIKPTYKQWKYQTKLRKGAPFGRTHRLRKALNSLYKSAGTVNNFTIADLRYQGLSTKQQQQFARVNLDAATENGNITQLDQAIRLFETVLDNNPTDIKANFPKNTARQEKYAATHTAAQEKYEQLQTKDLDSLLDSTMATPPPAAGAGDPARASARPKQQSRKDSETTTYRR